MNIEVTHEDIASDEHGSLNCPIALALVRAGYPNCCVKQSSFSPNYRVAHPFYYAWPERIRKWIVSYDARQPVQPITFELQRLPCSRTYTIDRNDLKLL